MAFADFAKELTFPERVTNLHCCFFLGNQMNLFFGDKSRPSRAYGAEIGVYICCNELAEVLNSASAENITKALASEDYSEASELPKIPSFYTLRSESTEITQGILVDKSYGFLLDEDDNLKPEIQNFLSENFDILEILKDGETALAWIKGLKSGSLEVQLKNTNEFRIETTHLQDTTIISNVYIDDELLDSYQEQWSEADDSISGLKVFLASKKDGSVVLEALVE